MPAIAHTVTRSGSRGLRKSLSLLGLVLPLGVLIAGAPPATAFTITQTSTMNVGNPAFPATGCLDVQNGDTADKTRIGLFPCNNKFNEQWIYQDGQLLAIGTANGESKCLTVQGGPVQPGRASLIKARSKVELDTCVPDSPSQLWAIECAPCGSHSEIAVADTKLCLDSLGQIGGGLQLVIEDCSPTAAGQQWDLKGVTITQTSNQNVGNPAFPATACVDVQDASTADGTRVGPFPCNNQFNEQWIYHNGHFLGIGTANGESQCLSVNTGTPPQPLSSGQVVELRKCDSKVGQVDLWVVFADLKIGDNRSRVVAASGGTLLCLDSGGPNGQIGGGLQLVVNTCDRTLPGQRWYLK